MTWPTHEGLVGTVHAPSCILAYNPSSPKITIKYAKLTSFLNESRITQDILHINLMGVVMDLLYCQMQGQLSRGIFKLSLMPLMIEACFM
jgi:hypothetical protein